jgi:hypothetical protein
MVHVLESIELRSRHKVRLYIVNSGIGPNTPYFFEYSLSAPPLSHIYCPSLPFNVGRWLLTGPLWIILVTACFRIALYLTLWNKLSLCALGTSDFEAKMTGLNFWKDDENLWTVYKNRFTKYWVVACILDFLAHRKCMLTLQWDENFFLWMGYKKILLFIPWHFLLRLNLHFWNQYEKTDFLYPIRLIWRKKVFLSYSSLEETKNIFENLNGQNTRNRSICRKMFFL